MPAERRVAHASTSRDRGRETSPAEPGGADRIVSVAADHDLGARAVVGQKEDERVVPRAHRAKLIQHATDFAVHAIDHRGVNRHLRRLKLALAPRSARPTAAAG